MFSLFGVFGLICITAAVTYAFFNYAKTGASDNTITTGTIKFLYTEESGQGRGITITDAIPVASNTTAKNTAPYFDFRITAEKSASDIKYFITARESKDSDSEMEGIVDLYLSNQAGTQEFLQPTAFNDATLYQYPGIEASDFNEKVIYSYTIPSATTTYNQDFRLRMWIDEDTNYSARTRETSPATCSVNLAQDVALTQANCEAANGEYTPAVTESYYPYNGKTFKITVNVYSTAPASSAPTISSESIGYTNAANPNVASISDALDDLNTIFP